MKNHHEGGKGLRGGGNRELRLRHIEVSSCVDFLLQRVRDRPEMGIPCHSQS